MPLCNFAKKSVLGLASCSFSDAESCQAANVLDRAVAHILRSKLRYGLIGNRAKPKVKIDPFPKFFKRSQMGLEDSAVAPLNQMKYDELALRIARHGIVLLKNEGGILPKRPWEIHKVAVLGTPEHLETGDQGSSSVKHSGETVTVMQGLQVKYGMSQVVLVEDLNAEGSAEIVRTADLVVLDVGLSWEDEGEFIPPATGGDRSHLGLRPADVDLIRKVSKLSNKVVVVMTSGVTIVVEDFVNLVPAILWFGYPGPQGGRALADILAGDVNPAGRMTSVTPRIPADYVPKGITLTPWDGAAEVKYPDVHGFKHMWSEKIKPRYSLGFGLSYTTFSHGMPSLEADGQGPLPSLTLTVEVSNTGAVAGIETVQVYARCSDCTLKRLPILLVGFARTAMLAPGASAVATVVFSAKELAIYDTEKELWLLEKGTYDIMEGPCADPDRVKAVQFAMAEDVTFDYPGAASPPDVQGAGADECGTFRCRRDEEFLTNLSEAEKIAMTINACILLAVVLVLLTCCCCFWRRCCRCGKSADAGKKKVKKA
mmetsp:Transcript_31348/g.79482  ORF Transcript_31348/g.79482 Transcript_31348/m.79482 type:complete len:541 (+) Transcript_31348:2-1624(+)